MIQRIMAIALLFAANLPGIAFGADRNDANMQLAWHAREHPMSFKEHEHHETVKAAVGIQGWFSQADAKWQISFPYVTGFANPGIPPETTGRIESELEFENIDSPMTIVTGGGKVLGHFALEISLGYGSIRDGDGKDTDRFLPNSGGGLEFSESKNDPTGNVRSGELNIYYNNHRYCGGHDGPWGAVLGYAYYADRLRMRNGVQTVSVAFDGTGFPQPGPFPSSQVLDTTYAFLWQAVKLGVLYQAELTEGLSLSGVLSFYPFVEYRGEGFWNLRAGPPENPDAFRRQSPNFIHTSHTGYGHEASLGLTYAVAENIDLSAGYRYLHLYSAGGTDTVFFANGSTSDSRLDWATVVRRGAYAEVLFKF